MKTLKIRHTCLIPKFMYLSPTNFTRHFYSSVCKSKISSIFAKNIHFTKEMKNLNTVLKKGFIYLFVLAALIMLLEHCARIPGSISGGAKDEDPPQFVRSLPANHSTNFGAKRAEIFFDEYLQLKDVNNQFYSSPPMTKKPEILLYGKKVRLNFKEPLLPDMTYTFDFGQSITDLNEGNIASSFLYVFSTGDYIDSLTFTGRVLNAFDMRAKTKEDKQATWVMLYNDLHDSVVYRQPPTYIARADQWGFFTFSHIRPDTFRIFALRDMNGNLKFDMPTERIAFADSLIVIDQRYHYAHDSLIVTSRNTPDSIKEMNPELLNIDVMLYQFEEEPVRQYRMAYERKESNKLRLIYSLPVDLDSLAIDLLEYESEDKWYKLETSARNDTLDYWLTDTALISQKTLMAHLYSPRTDSLNRIVYTNDTLKFTYEAPKQPPKSRRDRKEEEDKPKPRTPVQTMTIATNVKSGGTMDLTDRLQLIASQPIADTDPSKIILTEEVDTLKKPVTYTFTRDSLNIRKAYLDWKLKEDTKYFLTIDSMSFTSIYGVFNDSTGFNFRSQKEDYYSILEITFENISCPLVVQALKSGDKEEVVKQVRLTEGNVATIDFLKPDKYKIKVILDSNENGKWDTGNYLKKIQPEKVEYFSEPEVATHSGVTTELQWTLGGKKEEESEKDGDESDE